MSFFHVLAVAAVDGNRAGFHSMTFIAHKAIQSQGMGKSTRCGGTFIGFPRIESGEQPLAADDPERVLVMMPPTGVIPSAIRGVEEKKALRAPSVIATAMPRKWAASGNWKQSIDGRKRTEGLCLSMNASHVATGSSGSGQKTLDPTIKSISPSRSQMSASYPAFTANCGEPGAEAVAASHAHVWRGVDPAEFRAQGRAA